ncbi:META domain-containing protein [Pricia sp. S334]|uniref:META domain-containing protein n=1 Tax=Pricia mediterranea TaxID=3076079 RepID=A0ABU3L364_9FLAO|nr:META domain-containing protein [Pricia sp. S334]MDT7827532.1 META domain-containing protein [Pricia sp. S334]
MKTKFATLAAIALTMVSCTTTKKMNQQSTDDKTMASNDITNSTWQLVRLEGDTIDQSNHDGEKVRFILNASGQTVTGYSGCNFFSGTYSLQSGNRIEFSQIASTRMACPDAEINEQGVLEVFNLADNYTLNGDQLMLNVGKRAPLAVFRKMPVRDQIVEKYWKLKTLEGQDIQMAENQEREVYFTLKTDENRVQGFAGCNTLSGEYQLEEGNRIRFSKMATTMRACPDVEFNESKFLKVFELADNYTINGDTLSLNVGRRAPLAVFEAVYF